MAVPAEPACPTGSIVFMNPANTIETMPRPAFADPIAPQESWTYYVRSEGTVTNSTNGDFTIHRSNLMLGLDSSGSILSKGILEVENIAVPGQPQPSSPILKAGETRQWWATGSYTGIPNIIASYFLDLSVGGTSWEDPALILCPAPPKVAQ